MTSIERDTEITKKFKSGISMLDLALQYDMSYTEILNAIRRIMIREGVYDHSAARH